MARHIIVTDRDTDAEAYVARRDSAPARYYDYLIPILKRAEFAAIMKPNKEMPDDELTVAWALSNFIVAGSAQTVAEKILAFREAVGPFGTIVMVGHDWDDPQVHKRSMQLMAERVIRCSMRQPDSRYDSSILTTHNSAGGACLWTS